jgi:hypothetical protein
VILSEWSPFLLLNKWMDEILTVDFFLLFSDRVRNISIALGLTPVMWNRLSPTATFDTDGTSLYFLHNNPYAYYSHFHKTLTSTRPPRPSRSSPTGRPSSATPRSSTQHSSCWSTICGSSLKIATGYILPDAFTKKITIDPVVECLHKPLTDVYVELNDNKMNPPAASGGEFRFSRCLTLSLCVIIR